MNLEYVLPADIERRSFEIIESELETDIPADIKPVVIRAIHTTADFDYAENLYFSENVIDKALAVLDGGAVIVTDTNMAKAGINKPALARHGCECMCFMADEDIARSAKENGTTRATASVDKAAAIGRPVIYAVGNAPTALVRLCRFHPRARHRRTCRLRECRAVEGNAYRKRSPVHSRKRAQGRQQRCGGDMQCPALYA